MENADQVVTTKASREVIAQLSDWSPPVQVMIRPAGDQGWTMDIRSWPETHSDTTLDKVRAALRGAGWGWEDDDVEEAILAMQNAGILFRERA